MFLFSRIQSAWGNSVIFCSFCLNDWLSINHWRYQPLRKVSLSANMQCADASNCYLKCQPEIDWLVKQSNVQHLLWISVLNLESWSRGLQTMSPLKLNILIP
jgi:hypothetical protein